VAVFCSSQGDGCSPFRINRRASSADKPVTHADLTATILNHLGIDYTQKYEDEFQHLHNRLSDGQAVRDLG
jgi:hypothetical protein